MFEAKCNVAIWQQLRQSQTYYTIIVWLNDENAFPHMHCTQYESHVIYFSFQVIHVRHVTNLNHFSLVSNLWMSTFFIGFLFHSVTFISDFVCFMHHMYVVYVRILWYNSTSQYHVWMIEQMVGTSRIAQTCKFSINIQTIVHVWISTKYTTQKDTV